MFKTFTISREDQEYVEKEMKFISSENPERYRANSISLPRFALFCKKLGYYPDLDNFGKWQLNLRCEIGRMEISIWSVPFLNIKDAIRFYRSLISYIDESATNYKSEDMNNDNNV